MIGWCWHRWSKWSLYLWEGRERYVHRLARSLDTEWEAVTEERQRRTCERCGLVEDREVKK